MIFKLRFRRDGQQHVRYIGSQERADSVRRELEALQAPRRNMLRLGQLVKTARQMLKESICLAEPAVIAAGYKFHGRAIRRRRVPTKLPV